MFDSKGGLQRLKTMQGLKLNGEATIKLSRGDVFFIENTNLLSIVEKFDLLLISLGRKLTTEIYQRIEYTKSKEYDEPVPQDVANLEEFFSQLPYKYFATSYKKKNGKSGRERVFTWIQVCINERVLHFMENYAKDLTEMEEGVLYGYPNSAITAFSGLIDCSKQKQKESISKYYLGAGVSSDHFFHDENKYYDELWESVKLISPAIIKQAEKEFLDFAQKDDD